MANEHPNQYPAPSAVARVVSFRAKLHACRDALQKITASIPRLERLAKIAESTDFDGKPISDRIYDLLRANADMHFTRAEIMECIHIGESNLEAVRKALQRLCGRDLITRDEDLGYAVKQTKHMEGLTP